MKIQSTLNNLLGIDFPIIMAPMFLVSNEAMVKSAITHGIAGSFPSLNYRKEGELEAILRSLNNWKINNTGTYGVNLIVQKSNPLYEKHLKICVEAKVPFYITSLGNPKQVIEAAHGYGAKVFCDVTNITHAIKADELNCDGFIAVGQGAGGHAGSFPLSILVSSLKKHFPNKPIIAAGGIANGEGILSMLTIGAAGVSIGTRFIASTEAGVNLEYKNSIVSSKMEDIVLSEKLSGTPCTIINTPYAKRIGYTLNWFEKLLSTNNTTKKYFKMLVQIKGMKILEQSVKPGNYNNLWCAGQSVELIDSILPIAEIINNLKTETRASFERLSQLIMVDPQ
ncbi:MAG: nitronate monooxygenase [bacterium]|nr:nitronate monooxygenase [bacterium]